MDISYWLGRKYDLLAQNAAADTTRANAGLVSANAGANLDTVRAGLLPGQTAADIANTNAQARLTNTNATLAPGLAKASEAASYGGANANNEQAKVYGAQAIGENQTNGLIKGAFGGDSNILKILQALRLGLAPSQ